MTTHDATQTRQQAAGIRLQATGSSSDVTEAYFRPFDTAPYTDIDLTSEHPPAG